MKKIKCFANPYAHSSEKYFDIGSPYYIQGLTIKKEREMNSNFQKDKMVKNVFLR